MSGRDQRPSWLAETLGNRPFVVSVLYLSCFFLPLMLVVAVPLAFIFRRGPSEDWEASHYRYLTRTFWLGLGSATIVLVLGLAAVSMMGPSDDVGFPLLLIGMLAGLVVMAQFGVRSVLSMGFAVARQPMPRPDTLLF